MKSWFTCNLSVLKKYFLATCSAIFALLEIVCIFVSLDDLGLDTKTKKAALFLICLALAVLVSVFGVAVRNKKQLFGDINRGLTLAYGDIIKLGFSDKAKEEIIVVIPVNRCFDLSCEENLINPTSLHGQWIDRYITDEQIKKNVKACIDAALQGSPSPQTAEKPLGNQARYKPGTVVELPGGHNVTFYLLAFSYLDHELKAQSSEIEFYQTISGLIDYYNTHDNHKTLYCPVMGDHIVNPYRDTDSCLDFMLSVFKFKRSYIRGRINLIVYNKLRSSVSILDK